MRRTSKHYGWLAGSAKLLAALRLSSAQQSEATGSVDADGSTVHAGTAGVEQSASAISTAHEEAEPRTVAAPVPPPKSPLPRSPGSVGDTSQSSASTSEPPPRGSKKDARRPRGKRRQYGRIELDLLEEFISSCLLVDFGWTMPAEDVWKSYELCCQVKGVRPVTRKKLGQQLSKLDIDRGKSRGVIWYDHLRKNKLGVARLELEYKSLEQQGLLPGGRDQPTVILMGASPQQGQELQLTVDGALLQQQDLQHRENGVLQQQLDPQPRDDGALLQQRVLQLREDGALLQQQDLQLREDGALLEQQDSVAEG